MFGPKKVEETAFTKKSFEPGTYYARILDIRVETPTWDPSQLKIVTLLEGEDLGAGFEGWAIDRENPDGEKYKGQTGYVDNGPFAFKDYEKNGKVISTTLEQAERWVNNLIEQMGVFNDVASDPVFLDPDKPEIATFEDYLDIVKKYLVGKWGWFTLGGKPVEKNGHTNYYLYFPKPENKQHPFVGAADKDAEIPDSFMRFNAEKHISKKKDNTDGSIGSFAGKSTGGLKI